MKEIIGNSIKDKQEEIFRILGFDYETFKNTANFEQKASDSFSKLQPKDAKLLVMKILQLNQLEFVEKRCREEYKILFDKGSQLKTQLTFLKENIREEIDPSLETNLLIEERSLEQDKIEWQKILTEIDELRQPAFQISQLEKTIKKFQDLDTCSECGQKVNPKHKQTIIKNKQEEIRLLKINKDYNLINKLELANTSYNNTITKLANVRNKLNTLKEKEEKIKQLLAIETKLQDELETIKQELDVYKELIEAFGKNGITSYIIDAVSPEIETIANDMLQKLDIDFSISIDTKKKLKSGEVSETFDINISNGKYVRPYYLFSGGESFLIDLALRIALSVILLRRKGCSNSTLIIDEGMGSLDTSNSKKVVALINMVQKSYGFKKVLLVTHVPQLQDQIQTKIEIKRIQNPYPHSEICYNKNEENKDD